MPVTTKVLYSLPNAALGVAVTPNATAWAASSWVQITSSAPTDMVLAGFSMNGSAWTNTEFEVEFGVGAASSEVVVARLRATISTVAQHNSFTFPIPMNVVSSGQRLAVRVRAGNTNTTVVRIAVAYYDGTSYDSANVTQNMINVYPATNAAGTSIATIGTAWSNTAWSQLTASTATDILMTGIQFVPGGTAADFEIDIGTGSSGSETVIHTIRGRYDSAVGWIQNSFPMPVKINAGTRVAFRIRRSGTSTTSWTISAPYIVMPNDPPATPTLTSPANSATVGATPNLVFTTTDADGNPIQYQIQVDTVNTFDSQ